MGLEGGFMGDHFQDHGCLVSASLEGLTIDVIPTRDPTHEPSRAKFGPLFEFFFTLYTTEEAAARLTRGAGFVCLFVIFWDSL